MKSVLRFERFDAGLLAKAKRIGSGAARIPARLSRTGIQTYTREDGSTVREYRPPTEVFHADALASLAALPVTVGHPGMVEPETWRRDAVGHVGDNVKQDGGFVAGDVVVHDATAIERIDAGELAELSVGYLVEEDPTPGVTPEGERYDVVQRRIRGNHVALLPKGGARAGRGASLRLDSNGNEVAAHVAADRKRRTTMEQTIRLDGIPFGLETESERAAAVRAVERMQLEQKQKLDAATTDATAQRARADAAETKLAAAEAKLAATEAKLTEATDPKRLDARVVERTELLEKARAVHPELKCDGKSDAEVRREVVAYARPDVKLDGKSDDRIAGMFDALTGDAVEAERADGGINRTTPAERHDATDGRYTEDELDEFAAAERSAAHHRNLHRPAAAGAQQPADAGN